MKYKIQNGGIVKRVSEEQLQDFLDEGYIVVHEIPTEQPIVVKEKKEPKVEKPKIIIEDEEYYLMHNGNYISRIIKRKDMREFLKEVGISFNAKDTNKELAAKRDMYIAALKQREALKNENR